MEGVTVPCIDPLHPSVARDNVEGPARTHEHPAHVDPDFLPTRYHSPDQIAGTEPFDPSPPLGLPRGKPQGSTLRTCRQPCP